MWRDKARRKKWPRRRKLAYNLLLQIQLLRLVLYRHSNYEVDRRSQYRQAQRLPASRLDLVPRCLRKARSWFAIGRCSFLQRLLNEQELPRYATACRSDDYWGGPCDWHASRLKGRRYNDENCNCYANYPPCRFVLLDLLWRKTPSKETPWLPEERETSMN